MYGIAHAPAVTYFGYIIVSRTDSAVERARCTRHPQWLLVLSDHVGLVDNGSMLTCTVGEG